MRKGTFRTLPVKVEAKMDDDFCLEVDAKIKASVEGEPCIVSQKEIEEILEGDDMSTAISDFACGITEALIPGTSCHAKITIGKQVIEINVTNEESDVIKGYILK